MPFGARVIRGISPVFGETTAAVEIRAFGGQAVVVVPTIPGVREFAEYTTLFDESDDFHFLQEIPTTVKTGQLQQRSDP